MADDIKRGRAARNAKLASIPVGFAGRAALGFGKRLTGKSRDEVNAELMEKAANQLFTVLVSSRAALRRWARRCR